ncbi:MAG: hypothetical protein JO077_16245 [Verrucomicrobia bacterium]|nr:hypothetical protein [Verrucomicrobiota bacterium]
MPIYAPVFRGLSEAGIRFIVIGGHAVVLHGYQRNTFDLDLLVPDRLLTLAKTALQRLGYSPYFESEAFLQLTAPRSLPPLDIMVVDGGTFEQVVRSGESRVLDDEQILIPDAKRLIAMKLHALKAVTRARREQDWADIVGVIRATNQAIEDTELREIIERYGPSGAFAELRHRLG